MKYILIFIAFLTFACADKSTGNLVNPECDDISEMPEGLEDTYVRIIKLIPNPEGTDDQNEKFILRNYNKTEVEASRFTIVDVDGIEWKLGDYLNIIGGCQTIEVTSNKSDQLLNSGEIIYLYKDSFKIQTISYSNASQGQVFDYTKIR